MIAVNLNHRVAFTLQGKDGGSTLLEILKTEVDLTMALMGEFMVTRCSK